jgi:hypothetical protein
MNLFRHAIAIPKGWLSAWVLVGVTAGLLLTGPTAKAQSSSATLDGTVADASGAIVPGATVILKNQASGDERNATSNAEGFFNFAAVPPGTYTIKITRQGFANWEAKDVTLTSGDHRNVNGIKLKVGANTETVEVSATTTPITPTDSGEKSFTIDQQVLQDVSIIGQNAAEFIKIMPGMAMTAGATNQNSYTASDEGTGHGPIGSFSANGQRTGALDITADGAHIIDPGCNCGQAENTNAEMTQEVTVATSNFGADSAKGPVVINTVGKSGGQQFHGEAYLFARYYSLNANDWLANNAGVNAATGKQIAPRPETKYWYPGGQIGGPVLIPGTQFNHNRDKLFFFFATELYRQAVDNGIYHAVVPTDHMRAGDFTQADSNAGYLANLLGYANNGVPVNGGPNQNAFNCTDWTLKPDGSHDKCLSSMLNGTASTYDPTGTGPALVNTYPHANADPATNGGYNYINAQTRYSNMNQYRARVDYSISNSTKLYVQYNHQNDNSEESLDTLWTGNAQSWADPTTPYPSPILATSRSEVITANMTKVFTPTLTNEVIFNWVYLNLPNTFKDRSKVERGALGINYTMLFNHPNQSNIIFPEMTGWGDGISNQLNTGFELNGNVYAKKTLPSIADNISKVWKTHTAKFGFYWERTWNQQPGDGAVNGSAIFSNWGTNTSGNAYADMLIGQTTQYSEQNFDVVPAFRFITTAFFAQDSWKVSRRVTLDMGLRIEHLGPWVDNTGYGFGAWYPNLYAQNVGGSASGELFPGIEWHKAHSQTPLSGSASRLAYISPRVGFAWDLFGTGNTVLRGGYGIFHYHDEQNVQNGAYSIVRGSFSSTPLWSPSFSSIAPQTGPLAVPSSVQALDPKDDQEPRTQDWSFTVAHRTPWKSLVEVAYVGSKSDYLSNYNNNFDQINDVNVGTLFNATFPTKDAGLVTPSGWLANCDPNQTDVTAADNCQSPTGSYTNGFTPSQENDTRPLQAYGSLKIIDHKMYSNYHGLQVTWNKQQGNFYWLLNYTFSKALGIRGEGGSATGNPLSLKSNYGTLPNNRPNIFNAAYVYNLPKLSRANPVLRQAVNGWALSGITQYQSGADLQASVTSNFGYTAFIPAGTTFMGKTTKLPIQAGSDNTLGTPDITLMPKLVCDPRHGLAAHQYVNGNCFSNFVTPGQQGQYIFPTLIGPGFFNSDLSVFKNFTFGESESRKLQFRFSGYNFLNHPVRSFNGNSDPGLSLQFDSSGNLKQPAQGVTFGYANYKVGHRLIQGEFKLTF